MKKTLIYISVLISVLIAAIAINTVNAQSGETPATMDELLERAEDKSGEAVAENLYLDIYKKTALDPAEETAKKTGQKLKLSEDEVNKVILKGEIGSIVSEDDDIQNLTAKYRKMYQEYYSTLNTENLRSELKNKINPSEIFKDGDTSNSEFDLLYDLTVIEVILFNESSISSYGGKFAMPDFDFTDPEEQEEIEDLFGEEADPEAGPKPGAEDEFSALSCFAEDANLENALNEYEDTLQAQNEGLTEEDEAMEDITFDETGFPKSRPDEWPASFLCPEGAFFCMEISFDFGASKVYSKTDNCVFCHVQNINKEIDKMLNKSLTANKITGNLFEMPKCKSSFSDIGANMNVITMAVPPPKQAKTDMYVNLNIEKEWQKLKEKYKPFLFDTGGKEMPDQNVGDRATRKAISNVSPEGSLQEVTNKTNQVITGKTQESEQAQDIRKKSLQTELQNKEYQTLIEELDAWKVYFKSIKELFDKMLETCNEFANTPYCS